MCLGGHVLEGLVCGGVGAGDVDSLLVFDCGLTSVPDLVGPGTELDWGFGWLTYGFGTDASEGFG